MDADQDKAEPRYTLDEAEREIARRECSIHGHDLDVVLGFGINSPQAVVCRRCGASWGIAVSNP